jgi:hypothetical protein
MLSPDINTLGVKFVMIDLDLAHTFMDVADTSSVQETITRNHENARTAYETIVKFLRKFTPNALQQRTIDAKLGLLKERLLKAGQQF